MSASKSPPTVAELSAAADLLLRDGQVEDGISAYRTLLERAPMLADAWYNLAYLERCARRFDDALSSYGVALSNGISSPEDVHVNRAVILSEHLDRGAEAEAELQAAIAAKPDFLPAWLNLGLLNEDRGNRSGARAAYSRAAQIDPLNGRAHARLAAIDIAGGTADKAVARLRVLLREPRLAVADTAELGFALGNALDAVGDYDAAFMAFVAANSVAKMLIPPELRYQPDVQDQLVDDLIRTFSNDARHAEPGGGAPPVFICGMFRSGSTLCERLLAQHSRVTAGGELETIPALVAARLQPYPAAFLSLSNATLDSLRADCLRDVQTRFPVADTLTDKRCDNVLHIGLIKTLFPEAKIVHTRRHAIDTILSVFFLHFDDGIAYGFSLDDAVHYYKSYRRLMDHWRTLYGDDILDFDYDAVVRDPEQPMQSLLDFCGLEREAGCLTGQPADGVVRTASAWQVRQPLHARSSGRWRNYAAHIADTIAALDGY